MKGIFCIASVFLLGTLLTGCQTGKQAAAVACVPFAAAGDTAIVPFQAMGNASEKLIQRGYEVDHYTRNYGATVQYVERDNPADLFYYVPGYSLFPFQAFSQYDYYGMTEKCLDTAGKRKPSRRDRVLY
jgi:hypothetical protein